MHSIVCTINVNMQDDHDFTSDSFVDNLFYVYEQFVQLHASCFTVWTVLHCVTNLGSRGHIWHNELDKQ